VNKFLLLLLTIAKMQDAIVTRSGQHLRYSNSQLRKKTGICPRKQLGPGICSGSSGLQLQDTGMKTYLLEREREALGLEAAREVRHRGGNARRCSAGGMSAVTTFTTAFKCETQVVL
jgi:hypothetical protein